MKVLFLRYYIVTLVVLFGLIAGMDRAFWHFYDKTPHLSIDQVVSILSQPSRYKRIPADMITLPQEQQALLKAQGWISLQHPSGEPVFYLSSANNMLVEYAPLPNDTDWRWIIWPLVFYSSLAMALFLFLRPFFKDVQTLRQQVKAFAQTKDDSVFNANTGAFVRPVLITLRELSKRITELLNLQRDLTATISHEMRTPLARIKMHLAGDPHVQSTAVMINDDIKEMESLINEYLLYTQLEYEHPKLDKQWMSMYDLVMPIVDKYHCYSNCCIDYQGDDADLVNIDPKFFGRIINNLIDNAVKYAKDEIHIRFSVLDDNQCRLSVEDNGTGFQHCDQTLSKPYQRAHDLTTAQGYGLGLAIVNKAIGWHQGTMKLSRSTEFKGACVEVNWPRQSVQ